MIRYIKIICICILLIIVCSSFVNKWFDSKYAISAVCQQFENWCFYAAAEMCNSGSQCTIASDYMSWKNQYEQILNPNTPDCCQFGILCEGILLKHIPLFWGGGHTPYRWYNISSRYNQKKIPESSRLPHIGLLDLRDEDAYLYHAICVYSVTIYGDERDMCYTVFYIDPWFGEFRYEINNSPYGHEFSKIYILDC